jgi:hypothetical protein
MGQFKPMVKMETTEPSIELKLKKGGSVAHKKMKADTSSGHKSMKKMADGGTLAALANAAGSPMIQSAPVVAPRRRIARPSLAARRAAMMMANRGRSGMPIMKKGGEAESAAEHKSEMKKISKVESELKAHEGKKASTAHKGLNKGGACYAEGGVIKSTKGETKMHTAEYTGKSGNSTGDVKLGNGGGYKTGGVVKGNGGGYATGGVALGNAGGFKKGGKASKKAFANGGSVNNAGKAVSMPQGNKPASKPVSIDRLSGTFKKGGKVTSAQGRLQGDFARENATAMKQAKAYSNLKYPKKLAKGGISGRGIVVQPGPNVMPTPRSGKFSTYADGGPVSDSDMAYTAVKQAEKAGKKTMINPSKGSITVKEREVTRTPAKVYPSGYTDADIDRIINSKAMQEALTHDIDKKRGGKVRK